MTKSPRKNVPDVGIEGIELGAACMPSEHASDRATAPGQDRSCQNHICALYSLIQIRKFHKKDNNTCFVDCRKAFDTVNRDCLWFKLMSLGMHSKILQAIQSLYINVSCSVRINEYLTDFFFFFFFFL